MSTARELLAEFFECLRSLNTSVNRCVALFAEDGVFEFPYMPTIGIPARFQGHEAIRGVLELIRSHFPSITLSNIAIHDLKDGSGLFVEYHSEGFIGGTEKVYAQDYVSHLDVENGKIKLFARVSEHHFERAGVAAQRSGRRAGSDHVIIPQPPTYKIGFLGAATPFRCLNPTWPERAFRPTAKFTTQPAMSG